MFAVDFYASLPYKWRYNVVLTHTAEPLFPNTIMVKKKIDIFDFAHASEALNLVVESYRSVHQWPCLAYLSKPHW